MFRKPWFLPVETPPVGNPLTLNLTGQEREASLSSTELVRERLVENVEALCCALWNGLNTAGTILDLTSMEIYEE